MIGNIIKMAQNKIGELVNIGGEKLILKWFVIALWLLPLIPQIIDNYMKYLRNTTLNPLLNFFSI